MSTSSAIGMKMEDGTVAAVRCNWDGYPEGVGRILAECYRDRSRVRSLLALGFLSSLGRKTDPEPGASHSWQHPQPDVTVAYHRDRGEPLVTAAVFASVAEYEATGEGELGADYLYLLEGDGDEARWAVLLDDGWTDMDEFEGGE